jgi:[acyl-carrier-protein] S-malonyltransferase
MLAELAEAWPQVHETFAEASQVLGEDLWRIARDNPDDALNQTRYTQPAMLAAGIAVARVWEAAGGPAPSMAAGHSLGEYSALVVAGALGFDEAVRLVAERARLMQEAVPAGEGGMAAILGLDDDRVAEVCEGIGTEGIVEPVNYNAPGQVVIAGHARAVEAAVEAAREAGARRAVSLPVSVPSHSSLMRPAAEALGEVLATAAIGAPAIPVVHNVDASVHSEADGIREALRRQLYNPVRWTDSVAALQADGAELLLELGPGKVLTGLARRIDRRLSAVAVEDPESLDKALAMARGDA